MPKSENNNKETAIDILANIIHDLNPLITLEEAKNHIIKNGDKDKEFFGSNGEGYEQYTRFKNRYDVDNYKKAIKQR